MGRKGRRRKYEMGRGREGKRGERVRAQPPRGGTGGEVKEWVGDVKGGGRGEGRAGASIQWGMTHVASLKFQGEFCEIL